ncbi:hypothetical protein EDC02_5493 [Micromonospora sp. Llam0]|nr:hypothetical protein EDC02_5493 [Micromonospora sp. Llam0]
MVARGDTGRCIALVLPAVLAAAVVGCSPQNARQSDDDSQPEPPVEMMTVDSLEAFSLPLDTYRLSKQSAQVVSQAFEELFVECMQELGFTEEPWRPSPASDPEGNEGLYGVTDKEEAQRWGYHPPQESENSQPDSAPRQVPSAAWQTAAEGSASQTAEGKRVPDGGCRGAALRELSEGTPNTDVELADRLAIDSYQRSKEDSRVLSTFSEWSECMRQLGFEYPAPMDANNDETWWSSEAPSSREIATAVADVECKQQVGLINIWASVHTAYEKRAIEENAEALASVQEYRRIEEANALAVLERR